MDVILVKIELYVALSDVGYPVKTYGFFPHVKIFGFLPPVKTFGFLAPKTFLIIWFSTLLNLSVSDEVYSRN